MAGVYAWVTYASNDEEGLKIIVLARSLRQSITTRQLRCFISTDVSEELSELIQDEFDSCIRISKRQRDEFPGKPFDYVAQIICWRLKKFNKFVFLNCNCLILSNCDQLFKDSECGNGIGFVNGKSDGKAVLTVTIGTSNELDIENALNILNNINQVGKGDFGGKLVLDEQYCTPVNLLSEFTLRGNNIKIVHFVENHPIELLFRKNEDFFSGQIGQFEQSLWKHYLEFLSIKWSNNKLEKTWDTFNVNEAIKLLKTPSKLKGVPDLKLLEELRHSIAIVGMGFRFPGAENIDDFWNLLVNGHEGIIKVPEGRWNKEKCLIGDDDIENTEAGFLKCPIDTIDGKFFGINTTELEYMDPQQRLTMQVVWEGLENAGIDPLSLKNTITGIFGGWWRNDYKEILQENRLNDTEFFRAYMGNALGTLTGRISHFLELTGPSIATESGCSTSMVGVDMACNSLRNENCDIGLALGVNLFLHPFNNATMSHVVAMDGRCKTFDAKADGFGRAEGCAVLVLKRFSDAAAQGDKIWGLIRGSAVVQEGPSRSMGTPTVQCEALAMSLALERAGVQPSDISFVESHGTGTPVGDPLEMAAIAKVYSKGRKDELIVGSVKTNIGHTESVSGIAGIIKTVVSLENEMIPPHLHLEKLNPEINLESIPAQIPRAVVKWQKNMNMKPRIAGVSSFGITGTDAHVIIQETPEIVSKELDIFEPRPIRILTISAKSQEALDSYLREYRKYLQTTKQELIDIEYTTHLAVGHFPYRVGVLGATKDDVIRNIEKKIFETKQVSSGESPKICFLFTGQGSQYTGMAHNLYETSLVFKSNMDICERLLNKLHGFSIKDTIWGKDKGVELSRTIYSQTSIFCIEYCLLKLWESWGIKPDCVVGHSLGEFAAAVAAGILEFEDALKLVVTRSKLIDKLPGGKMLVLKENLLEVEKLIKKAFNGAKKWLDVAAVNSSEQTVLAGEEKVIRDFASFCEENNIKTHILDASHAFHSRHMDPVLEEYRKTASGIQYNHHSSCTFISGMEGKVIKADDISADYWVRHTREKVNFLEASKTVFEVEECTIFLEIGPQPVLLAMILNNSEMCELKSPIQACLPSIRKNENEWQTMLTTVAKLYVNGVSINWANYHRYCRCKKISVPSYPFQTKPFWVELNNDNIPPFHPLVGSGMLNPSSVKLFRSNIDVSKITFLKDHALGNKIIFPGAGFLEMCMVSGHAATQCTEGTFTQPAAAITIESFQIEAPLCLNDEGKTQLQVVVSSEDSGETRATIYSKMILDKDTHKWIRHASGIFSPFASKWEGEEEFKKDSLQNIKIRCSQKVTTEFTYSKLEEVGMKFGPTFQTIEAFWNCDQEMFFQVGVTTDPKRYVCHPVLIDSMFQALMICANPVAKSLHVPISISKFIWVSKVTTEKCFVYCKIYDTAAGGGGSKLHTALLLDSDGKLIAVMIGAELIETTIGNVMTLLEAQKMPYPDMYEDVWREQLGPCDRLAHLTNDNVNKYTQKSTELHDRLEASGNYRSLDDHEQRFYDLLYQLVGRYMIKGMHDLGFKGKVGEVFELSSIVKDLKVEISLQRMLCYMFMELTKDGYFKILKDEGEIMVFKVIKSLPVNSTVLAQIEKLKSDLKIYNAVDPGCVSATGECIADILTGRTSALLKLFPEDSNSKGPAELYYKESKFNQTYHQVSDLVFGNYIKQVPFTRETPKSIFRILEIGAGTGSATEVVLGPILDDGAQHYEYTYTDISPAFFPKGEKIFENTKMKVHYKVLNIEEDPTNQGFIPHHYDMVIASYVIHATKDIYQSMANVRNLLRVGGTLILVELVKPHRGTNMVFGPLEGFWRFTDTHLRPHNCEIDTEKWKKVLMDLDFVDFSCVNIYDSNWAYITAKGSYKFENFCSKYLPPLKSSFWIIFSDGGPFAEFMTSKLKEMGKRVLIGKMYDDDGDSAENIQLDNGSEEIFKIHTDSAADLSKIFDAVPKDEDGLEGIIYLWGLKPISNYAEVCQPFLNICKLLTTRETLLKVMVYTRGNLKIDDNEVTPPLASPILAMAKVLQNENQTLMVRCVDLDPSVKTKNIFQEAFCELFISDGEVTVAYRSNRRIVPRINVWKIPNTALQFPKSDRYQLILPPTNSLSDLRFGSLEKVPLKDNELEVNVKAYSLNFRDLFAVLKPDEMFKNLNVLGYDYAGVVTATGPNCTQFKTGDSIFGLNASKYALASHLQVDEDLVFPLPDQLTICEAATLPAVALTVYLCLVEVAKLEKGDTILIHTGSGGVGLCAIQLAKLKGATIVTTAGSVRKRAYLRNLGIKYIFNSRSTDFEKDIREALEGKGVDVVLNSLTGEGFKEASLAVCNPAARFIEMSKLNTWTKEEVKALRPDVFYELVDLVSYPKTYLKEYVRKIKDFINESQLMPIPYVKYDGAEIREALSYLQKAKHVGKIVVQMPEPRGQGGMDVKRCPYFNENVSYMVTGGLGGIGLEVAKWMANYGAKHIILVGRTAPKPKTAEEIQKLCSQGIKILVLHYDVGDMDQCKKLFNKIKSPEIGFPSLRGIMHAAGVLSDGTFYTQTWENFEIVFNSKVRGGWNMHLLSLEYPLEHFVTFSSMTVCMGMAGQGSHCSANYFLDSLVHYRNSIGLPGLTINWGQWGQVGIAADLEIIGLRPFTVLQGLSALEISMKSNKQQMTVSLNADFNMLRKLLFTPKKYIEELKTGQAESKFDKLDADKFWKEYEEAKTNEEKYEVVRRNISNLIRFTLKLEDDEVIDDHANLQDSGMDSLMMIEMKNALQNIIGKRVKITVNSVRDCKTVAQLSTRVVELISGMEELPAPSPDELIQLIKEDSELPDDIQPAVNNGDGIKKPSGIQTAFITGVSGNFGPYVLREICKRPEIQTIYCLMRDNRLFSPKERLKHMLFEKNLLEQIDLEKVECIAGDISQPKMGLTDQIYDELAEKVDGIFHLSVKAAMGEFYCKSENPVHSRSVNVFGAKQILRFACHKKTKYVFHASTTLSCSKIDSDGRFWESWPQEDEFDNQMNSAYPISKYICDRLMAQAVDRGVPIKVFRFPFMAGDSKVGGNVSILDNQLMLKMIMYMQMGVMPAKNVPIMIIPVDICANLSLSIFFNDETGYEMYNVSNPFVEGELRLEDFAQEFGYTVKVVEQDEFFEKMKELSENSKTGAADMLNRLSAREEEFKGLQQRLPEAYTAWNQGQKDVFLSKKLVKWIPEYPNCMQPAWDILKKDLLFAKQSGLFAKLGMT